MIGSHNKPPPPSNDKVFIAEENGEPETPLDAPPPGREKELAGGIDIEGKETLVGDVGNEPNGAEPNGAELNGAEPNGGTLDGADMGIGDNPDISLEYSTGSIPEGIGVPEAAAAATISAGVGSQVPVITL